MEFSRVRVRLDAQSQPRYVRVPDAGAAEGTRVTVALGEGRSEEAAVEALVQLSVEHCDAGRCAICRDNARTRFIVKQSDAHGMKKWCGMCLADRLAIEPGEVTGVAR